MSSHNPTEIAPRPEIEGFFDLQVNGFAGVDFQQDNLAPRDLLRAVKALRSRNTTRILLTLITDQIDRLCFKLERAEKARKRHPLIAATVVGYHLEGPYLLAQPGFSGAHPARYMKRPRIAEFERLWSASGGNLRLITLAPELTGSAEFIQYLVARGVRTAIGHSDANERTIDEAIQAGLSLCTHLGNAVPQLIPRHDNIIQRLLARDELYAAFIPDGIHLPPFVLKNLVRAKPANRVLFTTDCMAAAGAPPGYYHLGKLLTHVGKDGIVRQPGEKRYFAGSSLTMDKAMHNVQEMLGWTAAQAVTACSTRVAKFLGFPAVQR